MATRNFRRSTKFFGVSDAETEGDAYQDRWSLERTGGRDRLVIAPCHGRHVDVLLELTACLGEPFDILYVLLLSRTGAHSPGRYQSPASVPRDPTEAFVRRFADYLEGDGRHHLWLRSVPDDATLVYDNHDLVYAYGPLDRFRTALAGLGLSEGPVAIPAPHQHGYNPEYDRAEDDVIGYWDWKQSPLRPDDDP